MNYVSGLDDILEQKNKFTKIIPKIEIVIKVINNEKTRNFELYEFLEREFVSFCFGIKIVTEDVEKLNEIMNKQYSLISEQINKSELQKLIFDY